MRSNSILCLLCLASSLSGASIASAKPAQIVIIRHGEKTDPGNELNTQGCERAYSLPNFFLNNPTVQAFGTPVAIYAMEPDSKDGSIRPIQTIAPTANVLGLSIQNTYTRLEYKLIVQEIMHSPAYKDQTVLIAWEHDAIPGLAEAFGVVLAPANQVWPDTVFDEAWVITPGKNPALTIIPEDVLSTDNPDGGTAWKNGPVSSSPPVVSPSLAKTCVNNNSLNALVQKWIAEPSKI